MLTVNIFYFVPKTALEKGAVNAEEEREEEEEERGEEGEESVGILFILFFSFSLKKFFS